MMIRKLFACAFICLLIVPGCKENSTPEQRWLMFATGQIQSGYDTLFAQAAALEKSAHALCTQPSAETLAASQQQWRNTMDAWQSIQWVHFGPIAKENDDWKLQFWPDKKNIVQRKIQALLEGSEPVTVDSLKKASVVVQGLTGQEVLLFDPEFASVEKFSAVPQRQCALLNAQSALVSSVAGHLASAWQDKDYLQGWFQPAVVHAGQTPASVRNGELIDALLAHLEKAKGSKLGEPMGMKNRDKKPNGYFAESWRSGHSLANIEHNLGVLQNLTRPAQGYGLFQYLLDKNQKTVAGEWVVQIDSAQQALLQIQSTLSLAVVSADQQPQLQLAYKSMGQLDTFIKKQLAPALELSLGFNSNDGD